MGKIITLEGANLDLVNFTTSFKGDLDRIAQLYNLYKNELYEYILPVLAREDSKHYYVLGDESSLVLAHVFNAPVSLFVPDNYKDFMYPSDFPNFRPMTINSTRPIIAGKYNKCIMDHLSLAKKIGLAENFTFAEAIKNKGVSYLSDQFNLEDALLRIGYEL